MFPSSLFFTKIFCSFLTTYSWLARTDPRDVARVESKTVIVTQEQRSAVPICSDAGIGNLGHWMSPEEFAKAKTQRFPGCMIGKKEGVCFGLYFPTLETTQSLKTFSDNNFKTWLSPPQVGPCM